MFFQIVTGHSIAFAASEHTVSSRGLSFLLHTKIAQVGDRIQRRLISRKNGAYHRNYAFPSVYETKEHSEWMSSFPSIREKLHKQPTTGKLSTRYIPRRAYFRFDIVLPRLDVKRGRKIKQVELVELADSTDKDLLLC